MTNFRFSKSERLKGRKNIDYLFQTGRSIYKYPIRIVFNITPPERNNETVQKHQVKVAFSVPKRKIRSAVKRNQIRRRLSEAYRLNRHQFFDNAGVDPEKMQLHLIFIYQHTELLEYKIIERSVEKLLKAVLKSAE